MVITDIKQAKKEGDRVHLYGNDKYLGTIYIDYVLQYHIKINADIDQNTLDQIFKESNNKRLFNLSINYIMRRLRSEKEIKEYIQKKIFKYKWDKQNVEIDQIIDKLKDYKYINDESFARSWVESRIRKGLGPQRLKLELVQKGVEKNIIENILHEINDEDKQKEIDKLSEKYLRNKTFKNESEKKWKLKQYLMSRGF